MRDNRTSLVGLVASGFMVTLPLLLAVLVVAKLYDAVAGSVLPLMEALPGTVFKNTAVRFVVVAAAVGALFLVIGALARTRIGRVTGRWVELALLSRLPFYNVLRALASGLADRDDAESLKAVLVTVDSPGLQQLGLVIESHADGSATVFLPSSPNPGSGTVVVVTSDRLRPLQVPVRRLLQCLGRWGHGTADLLK